MKLGRDFWLFRFGQAVSVVGDGCSTIAMAWWVLDATGSAVAMSSVVAPAMLARIFLTPLFGPVGDRISRKYLIATSDLWRGMLMLTFAVMAYVGWFSLPAVIGVYVLSSVGSALYGPLSTSIVAQLVSPEKIGAAFQQTQAITAAGAVLGAVAGGALVTVVGTSGAFALDGVSFLIAVATTAAIRADTRPRAGMPQRRWAADLMEGFRFIYKVRVLLALALVAMVLNFVLAPLVVVLPILVKQERSLPPWYLGTLQSSMALGAVVGAMLVGWMSRTLKADYAVALAVGLMGLGVSVVAWAPGLVLPAVAMLVVGLASSVANVPIMSQMAAATPDAYRSRVTSIMLFLCQGAAPLGIALAGLVIASAGLHGTMTAMGLLTIVLAPVLLTIPHASAFFRHAPAEAGAYLKSQYPLAFAADSEPVAQVLVSS